MQDKRKFYIKTILLICICVLCLLFILAQKNYKPTIRGVKMPDVDFFSIIGTRIEQRITELSASEEQVRFRIMCIVKQANILKENVDSLIFQKGE